MAENSWNTSGGSSGMPDIGPSVPPPPSQVRVRTFRSDIESMMKSGGMQPQFQNVAAPTILKEEGAVSAEAVSTDSIKTIVAAVVALALLVGVGFFAYRLFFSGSSSGNIPPSSPPSTPSGGGGPSSTSARPSGTAVFVHASVFKKPADQVLALTLPSGSAGDASDLETFSQRMLTALNGANAAAMFLEINTKDASGTDLPLRDILHAGDMEVIDPAFFATHFNIDGSLFAYKDKNGFWPGFAFTLKPNDNWLFVKDDVAKLESSLRFMSFFLTVPGVPVEDGFKDIIIAGQPARILRFSLPGTAFVYGWFHNALIMSTSEAGLSEAIARL
jgi:hypothetical protein